MPVQKFYASEKFRRFLLRLSAGWSAGFRADPGGRGCLLIRNRDGVGGGGVLGRFAPQAALSPDAKQHAPEDTRNNIARWRFIRVDGNNPQG